MLHHPIRAAACVAAKLTGPKPWPYISGPIVAMWNRSSDVRQYWPATSCGSGGRGPRTCQFGGCWEACWQAGELTRVSRSMFAAVKEQTTSEEARINSHAQLHKRRRK